VQHLSPLDNSFLEIENDDVQANIGGVSVFEGPAPAHSTLLRLVESKLDRIPRYRQRVQRLPFGLGMPVWIDDVHFNLGYHLRRTALPAPGGAAELETLVGRVMSQHLDRSKPLWETWVVEGLEHGRWALLWKVHHTMVDGVSANDLMGEVLDTSPQPAPRRRARAWQPEHVSPLSLAMESVRGLMAPIDQLEAGLRQLRATPGAIALRSLATARTVLPIAPSLALGGHNASLNGPIGPHRRWTRASVTLDDVKTIRTALDGTVNDVVLALVTHGLRDMLRERGPYRFDIVQRHRGARPAAVRTDGTVERCVVPAQCQ
jgi:diacylglycerol O-acyltransferase / wax synthase